MVSWLLSGGMALPGLSLKVFKEDMLEYVN